MSTTGGQFLSDEAIASVRGSKALLGALQQSVVTAIAQDGAIRADKGVKVVLEIVDDFCDIFSKADRQHEGPLFEAIAEVMAEEIFPNLAIVVTELQQLWESVASTVRGGSDGMPLVQKMLDMWNSDEDTAARRMNEAIGITQGMALSEIADDMLGFR